MSEFVYNWKPLQAGEIGDEAQLSLEAVAQYVATRACTQALVEVASDKGLPLRVVASVGDDEVGLISIVFRRTSPKEIPS